MARLTGARVREVAAHSPAGSWRVDGTLVRTLRTTTGISIGYAAELLGVGIVVFKRLEANDPNVASIVTVERLNILAEVLGTTPHELLARTIEPDQEPHEPVPAPENDAEVLAGLLLASRSQTSTRDAARALAWSSQRLGAGNPRTQRLTSGGWNHAQGAR